MEQSDVEFTEIMKELKREIFGNRCHQERLREHLWRLKKEEADLETTIDMPDGMLWESKSEKASAIFSCFCSCPVSMCN